MAKKEGTSSADRDRQFELIGKGEQVEGGWCVDFDHPEVIYRCSEEEEAIARGDISVSVDRSKVLDLKSGEMTTREADFRRPNPMGMVPLSGDVPTATSDTGGGGRGPAAGAGGGTSA